MALILKESARFYRYIIHDLGDPETIELPLVKSPIPVLTILTVYLLFVLKWGPEYMKNRKPYNLKRLLIGYNIFQVVCCIILVIAFASAMPLREWRCTPIYSSTPEGKRLIWAGYGYFTLKIIDLMDTVFFVLRKNKRQVTLLHVYHHTIMVSFLWYGLKYHPGGQMAFIPFINTIVHVVMYGYYLLTVYDNQYKKSVWWKKHITQLQLFQFALLSILFTTPMIYNCGFPKSGALMVLSLNLTMVVLFSNFYYQTYIKTSKHT